MKKQILYASAALVLFGIAAALPVATAWSADEGIKTIEAVGSSRINSGNMSAAREEAVAAGLIAAVNHVLAESLPRETILAKFHLINDKVFSRTDEFVKGYKVLSESKSGGRYIVMVAAAVVTGRLMSELESIGVRAEQKSLPRVLVCVSEKGSAESDYRYWWGGSGAESAAGEALIQGLQSAGYPIVRTDPSPESASYPPVLGVAEASELGRRAQADVVVVGQARTEEVQAASETALRGVIELQAYAAANGRQLGQSWHSELGGGGKASSGSRQLLIQAAEPAGRDLARQIESAWFSQSAGRRSIEMVVAGTGGRIANLVKLRGSMSSMPGVSNVHIKEMRPDAAVLTVEYQGSARSLADALLLHNFETFGVAISQVAEEKIDLQLTTR